MKVNSLCDRELGDTSCRRLFFLIGSLRLKVPYFKA